MVKNYAIGILIILLFFSPSNNYVLNSKLPQHMVTGYWHNFCNGSTNLKLRDVPSYYDMICVSFTGNTATPGEVTFELDSYLASSVGGYTKQEFIQDIADLQSRGKHVIISVGGANGLIVINSATAADTFATSLSAIIREYGFEGVDIDLEGSAVSGTEYIARGLKKVHDEFGDDFIITMAPETYYMHNAEGLMGSYFRLAMEIKDILTICYPQFYNAGSDLGYNDFFARYPSQSFITSLATMYIENGLRPDQMAIGVPALQNSGAGSGYISINDFIAVINSLVFKQELDGFTPPREYKTLRGVMTWSINWDGTQNYVWGRAMAELMSSLPVVDGGNERPEDDDDITSDSSQGSNSDENNSDENTSDENTSDETSSDSQDITTDEPQDYGDIPNWDPTVAYFLGDKVIYNGNIYQAKWWSKGEIPENQGEWGCWKYIGPAGDVPEDSDIPDGGEEENSSDEDISSDEYSSDEYSSDETSSDSQDITTDEPQDSGEIPNWDPTVAYFYGDKVIYNGNIYQAKWWSKGEIPENQGEWGCWKLIGPA